MEITKIKEYLSELKKQSQEEKADCHVALQQYSEEIPVWYMFVCWLPSHIERIPKTIRLDLDDTFTFKVLVDELVQLDINLSIIMKKYCKGNPLLEEIPEETLVDRCAATYEEVRKLKTAGLLELFWDEPDEGESFYFFKWDGEVCAAIRLSENPMGVGEFIEVDGKQIEDFIWIDEFEVIKGFRGKELGKLCINNFLKDIQRPVKLFAKNKSKAEFWCKCGFVLEKNVWDDIPMIYI